MSNEEKDELFFTPEHIKKFRAEYSLYQKEEDFFLKKGVIELTKNGNWIILEGDTNLEDPITGLMMGNVPFRFYRRIQRLIEREDARIEYAKQKKLEHYEKEGIPETGSHNAYAH